MKKNIDFVKCQTQNITEKMKRWIYGTTMSVTNDNQSKDILCSIY